MHFIFYYNLNYAILIEISRSKGDLQPFKILYEIHATEKNLAPKLGTDILLKNEVN